MRKITKRTAAIAATAALGVGSLGVAAWANWFSGTGAATASTATAASITAQLTVTGDLYPTGTFAAKGTATNPNDYKVKVTGFTVTDIVLPTNAPPSASGCTKNTAGITIGTPTTAWIVAADAPGTDEVELGNIVQMNQWASSACAGLDGLTIKVNLIGEVAP